jgi:methyl-accepting chemotaxis protein
LGDIMNITSKFKIQHKMILPNVLYIFLLGAIIFFYTNSNALIDGLSSKQKSGDKAVSWLQKAATDIGSYLDKNISYSELQSRYKTLIDEQKQESLVRILHDLGAKVGDIQRDREENAGLGRQINRLADFAIKQSNDYIQQVVQRLVGEKTQAGVTTLEKQVIVAANINTTSNFRLKVLFGRLEGDIGQKEAFRELIEALLQNVEKAEKSLAGTPFEVLPKNAKASILKIRDLSSEYIKNLEAEQPARKSIFKEIETRLAEINNIKEKNSGELFSTLKIYLRNMLIIIFIASLVGILASVLTARAISRALGEIIGGMSAASQEVTSASGQLSSAGQSLSEGASEQAAAIEQTSASLHEMASMTRRSSESAVQCKTIMREVRQIVDRVNNHMNSMREAIANISTSSGETVKIVKTIDAIAFQTNLLALNAAVEAARAGEAGAGFAVVADEVRNLAMRAAEAAKSTTHLINNTIKAVEEGSGLMDLTQDAFQENIQNAKKADELLGGIAVASQEQAKGIEQISIAVADLEKITQQNAAQAEESAAASEEMNAQAEILNELVAGLVALVGSNVNRSDKNRPLTGSGGGAQSLLSNLARKTFMLSSASDRGEANSCRPTVLRKETKEVKPEQVMPFDEDDTDF